MFKLFKTSVIELFTIENLYVSTQILAKKEKKKFVDLLENIKSQNSEDVTI